HQPRSRRHVRPPGRGRHCLAHRGLVETATDRVTVSGHLRSCAGGCEPPAPLARSTAACAGSPPRGCCPVCLSRHRQRRRPRQFHISPLLGTGCRRCLNLPGRSTSHDRRHDRPGCASLPAGPPPSVTPVTAQEASQHAPFHLVPRTAVTHEGRASAMFSKNRRRACLVTSVLAVMSLAGCADGGAGKGSALQVSGSTTVAPVAADAAEALKADGLDITVATQGGSAGGISQLAAGQINIALSSKPLAKEDKAANPDTDFLPTQIGADAVGVIVTKEVADGGVKNLTADQVRDLFEGKINNWSEVGGPDLDVFVYDKEPGR